MYLASTVIGVRLGVLQKAYENDRTVVNVDHTGENQNLGIIKAEEKCTQTDVQTFITNNLSSTENPFINDELESIIVNIGILNSRSDALQPFVNAQSEPLETNLIQEIELLTSELDNEKDKTRRLEAN